MATYHDLSNLQRKLLRELAGKAFDRELERELKELGTAFDRWRSGEMEIQDLDESLEKYVRGGTRRKLAELYFTNSMMYFAVTHAIVRGVLKPEEVPAEIEDALSDNLASSRQGMADGTFGVDGKD